MDYLVHHLLRASAERFPEKEAVVHGETRLSYAAFRRQVAELASVLQSLGVRRGDRVGLFLPPGIPLARAIFAVSQAGGAFVPIHHSLLKDQVRHIASDCGMRVLVTCNSLFPHVEPWLEDEPALQAALLVDASVSQPNRSIHALADLEKSADSCRDCQSIEQDLAAILYTSGSTGKPKGVMLSHRNVLAGASIVSEYLGINENDRILAALPFSFDAGLNQLTTAIQQGGTIVLVNFVFAKTIVDSLIAENITGLAGVPPLWSLLAQPSSTLAKRRPQSLRYITNTGGVMPNNVLADLRESLPSTEVFLMYGLTEAFRSTYLPPEELDRRPGSMGKAIPNTEILVVNEQGRRCEPGEIGELVHHGPTVSLGYWGRPDLTAEVIRPHPFPTEGIGNVDKVVYSGDLVKTDEEGFLYFVGRRDNMIKTSGFRVSPSEVEEALCRTGQVQHAAVIGLPDERLGQRIMAFVTPKEGKPVDAAALLAACTEYLPNYMVPKIVEEIAALPRTASGKVDYQGLKFLALEKGA